MLDHVGFAVADAQRSRSFYERALAPLGISLIMTATPDQTEAGGRVRVRPRRDQRRGGLPQTGMSGEAFSGLARKPILRH